MQKQMRRSASQYREADQRLCFRYMEGTIPLLSKFIRNFKPLAIFCICTTWFVSDLVGNPEDRFFHNEAGIVLFVSSDILDLTTLDMYNISLAVTSKLPLSL